MAARWTGPATASAGGCCRETAARAPVVVHHKIYYPRYRHVYHVDPYSYYYSPRGYYPYRGSSYWRPLRVVRKGWRKRYNFRHCYRYGPSWGQARKWRSKHRRHHVHGCHPRRHHFWHY